jgi:tyrosinase
MLSRRSVLLGPSAAALVSSLSAANAQQRRQFVRFNASTRSGKEMLRIYADGVAAMKALVAEDPRSWIFQWNVHATPRSRVDMLDAIFPEGSGDAFDLANETWFTCQGHMDQPIEYFLPWHRLYVMHFEEIIRKLTRRDDFTLPYWDYTSAESYAIPEEFQARNRANPAFSALFVANRNKDGGPLRAADVNAGEPLNKYFHGRQNFLVVPDMNEPSYRSFCSQLNGQLHNQIHRYVGDETNMGNVPTAAGDPIFWLHHCNIDRLWTTWNASGGQNPSSTNGRSWSETSFVFADGEGKRVEVDIGTISSPTSLPYRYDTLPGRRGGAAIASAASMSPQVTVLLKSVQLSGAAQSSQASSAIGLGWTPVKVTLAPTAPQNKLSATATSVPGRLVLLLKQFQVQLDPNTSYQVFLDLPENASEQVRDRHYVGLLVFFGMAAGADQMNHDGVDVEFDVTDLVKGLSTSSVLLNETSVTFAPVGAPASRSSPTIRGGIELQRR